MALQGLHHITLISANMERTTRFYVDALGVTLVKQTVNFDDPSTRHFYFGDETGSPGTLVTYFEWPHLAPGNLGVGLTHHYGWWTTSRPSSAGSFGCGVWVSK